MDLGNWRYVLSADAQRVYRNLIEYPVTRITAAELAMLCRVSRYKLRQALTELDENGFLNIQED